MKLNIPADGVKIGHDGTKLIVPDNPIIPYIIGDGIGIDVTPVMKRVLDYAVNKAYGNDREIKWLELYAGSNSNDLYGSILPEETLNAMEEYRISIKGPLTTPIGSGHKSLIHNAILHFLNSLIITPAIPTVTGDGWYTNIKSNFFFFK